VYDDATQVVEVPRTLMDIWRGVPGSADKCMNAQCIERNAQLFPHKVMGVSVSKSRVFILDSHDHAVRYFISKRESQLIQGHDEEGVGEPGTLRLMPPPAAKRAGVTHKSQHTDHKTTRDGSRTYGLSRGEGARVLAAVGAGLREA
jgi:hypothetical protein